MRVWPTDLRSPSSDLGNFLPRLAGQDYKSLVRALVIGAGIAGLATAWHLAKSGVKVTIVEREPLPFSHSSGRNAAIFRALEEVPQAIGLARRSAEILDELIGREAWFQGTGLFLVAEHECSLKVLGELARSHEFPCEQLERKELWKRVPLLKGGRSQFGLWLAEAGVLDPAAISGALLKELSKREVRLVASQEVVQVRRGEGQLFRVLFRDGSADPTELVVVASGAWAAELGAGLGCPVPLRPLRRHLVHLMDRGVKPRPCTATVWDVEQPTYFRPESGGWLASPGDEELSPPSTPQSDPAALELLAERLAELAPGLARAEVRRSWACLRTFAPDRAPLVGPDRRCQGLIWLAGLGGFGMTLGLALGELAAKSALGELALPDAFRPNRFADGFSSQD